MNTLYLNEIENNLQALIQTINLKEKYIIMFGYNKPTEKMVLFLKSKGIKTNAIIDNNPKVSGIQLCGITVFLPKDLIVNNKDNVVILIASAYFLEMKKQLIEMGYMETQIKQIIIYHTVSDGKNEFEKNCKELIEGKKIYQYLHEKYGQNIVIIMCPYNGIGDIYLIASYLDNYCKKEGIHDYVITVVSNSCRCIAEMFELQNIELLSQEDSDYLMKLSSFIGQGNAKVKIFTHTSIHWDILIHFELAERIDWGTMFRYILMKTGKEKKREIPISDIKKKISDEFLKKYHIALGKTAILSPYANTIPCLSDEIWKRIINLLKEMGYDVYTNSTGEKEPALPDTKPILFPLEIAKYIIEKSGIFIGIRSGLCDVIESADCTIIILYPNKKMYFFNLESMGFGKNVEEVCCKGEYLHKIETILLNTVN